MNMSQFCIGRKLLHPSITIIKRNGFTGGAIKLNIDIKISNYLHPVEKIEDYPGYRSEIPRFRKKLADPDRTRSPPRDFRSKDKVQKREKCSCIHRRKLRFKTRLKRRQFDAAYLEPSSSLNALYVVCETYRSN